MTETYKGYRITITRVPIPSRRANGRGPRSERWKVTINGQDVSEGYGILHSNQPDEASVLASAKKYIDGLTS